MPVLLYLLGLFGGMAGGQAPAPRTLPPRVDSLRAALRAHPADDSGRVNRLNNLALALRTNALAESAALFGQALALASRRGVRPRVLLPPAQCLRACLGARQLYAQLYAQLGDGFNETRSQYGLARVYFEQGNYGESVAANLDGLALAQIWHDAKGQMFLSTQLGITNSYLADYVPARRYLTQGLALARRAGDPIAIGHAYTGLGDLYQR